MAKVSKDSIALNSSDSLDQNQKTLHRWGVVFGYRVVLPNPRYVARVTWTALAQRAHLLVFAALAVACSCVPLAAQSTECPPTSPDITCSPPFPPLDTCPIKAGIKSFVLEMVIGPTAFGSLFT